MLVSIDAHAYIYVFLKKKAMSSTIGDIDLAKYGQKFQYHVSAACYRRQAEGVWG